MDNQYNNQNGYPQQPYPQQGYDPQQQYPQQSYEQPAQPQYPQQQYVQQPQYPQQYAQPPQGYAYPSAPEPPKKKKTGVIIAVIAVILALALAGGLAAYFIVNKADDDDDDRDRRKDKSEKITTTMRADENEPVSEAPAEPDNAFLRLLCSKKWTLNDGVGSGYVLSLEFYGDGTAKFYGDTDADEHSAMPSEYEPTGDNTVKLEYKTEDGSTNAFTISSEGSGNILNYRSEFTTVDGFEEYGYGVFIGSDEINFSDEFTYFVNGKNFNAPFFTKLGLSGNLYIGKGEYNNPLINCELSEGPIEMSGYGITDDVVMFREYSEYGHDYLLYLEEKPESTDSVNAYIFDRDGNFTFEVWEAE